MSLRYKRKVVEDLIAEGVEQGDVDHLLDFLMSTVGKIAPALARSAESDPPRGLRQHRVSPAVETVLLNDDSGVLCATHYLAGGTCKRSPASDSLQRRSALMPNREVWVRSLVTAGGYAGGPARMFELSWSRDLYGSQA